MILDCENKSFEEILTALIDILMREDAFICNGLCIKERDFNTNVLLTNRKGMTDLLIRVPYSALVPIGDIEWLVSGNEIRFDSSKASLSQLQNDILFLIVSLYNISDKLQWFRNHDIRASFSGFPSILDSIKSLKPTYFRKASQNIEAFLKSRSLFVSSDNLHSGGYSVLMPIVDLINHHPSGSRLITNHLGLEVKSGCNGSSGEIFLQYRDGLDPIDLALTYAYCDTNSPFANCAPVSVKLPYGYRLTIKGNIPYKTNGLNFPSVKLIDRELIFSHLTCDKLNPIRFHVAIQLAIISTLGPISHSLNEVYNIYLTAIDELYNNNISLLMNISSNLQSLSCPSAPAEVLSQSVNVQMDNLRKVMIEVDPLSREKFLSPKP